MRFLKKRATFMAVACPRAAAPRAARPPHPSVPPLRSKDNEMDGLIEAVMALTTVGCGEAGKARLATVGVRQTSVQHIILCNKLH